MTGFRNRQRRWQARDFPSSCRLRTLPVSRTSNYRRCRWPERLTPLAPLLLHGDFVVGVERLRYWTEECSGDDLSNDVEKDWILEVLERRDRRFWERPMLFFFFLSLSLFFYGYWNLWVCKDALGLRQGIEIWQVCIECCWCRWLGNGINLVFRGKIQVPVCLLTKAVQYFSSIPLQFLLKQKKRELSHSQQQDSLCVIRVRLAVGLLWDEWLVKNVDNCSG